MDYDECEYSVHSTWILNDDSISIKEIISIEDYNNCAWMQLSEEELGPLANLAVDDNYIPLKLVRHNRNESCTLTINVDHQFTINKIIIISEARILEFYGKHGEYICTVKAHSLVSIGGNQYCIAQPNIPGTNIVTLKFCESEDDILLYGVTLLVSRSTPSLSDSVIDFANVDQILRSSNLHLTENAERAKDFIMNYNIKKTTGSSDSETLQNLLTTWTSLRGNASSSKSLATTLDSDNGNNKALVAKENRLEADNYSDIKIYVDKQLQQIEERIQNDLQLQLKEFEQKQNEKLDSIIQLLQKLQ